jgi:hypothetical protein
MRFVTGLLVLGTVGIWALSDQRGVTAPPVAGPIDFARDVRPILAKNCFACHGPDSSHRAASLRFDIRDSAVKPRKSRAAAIVAGAADKSELITRVAATDVELRMPPKETGNQLTPEQIAILRRWIDQGAIYAQHWSFVKPVERPRPVVKNTIWSRNGLDDFILSRLEKEGLQPTPEASRFELLRRASLDLRGLPPTRQEIEELARDGSPNAYEKAVDRFLNDAAYGERWARVWLDLARYADSAGYGSDPLRPNMWRYRDWVIDAFNRNLPFDQFTIEQLAGDLLPTPSLEQRIATAFHRNTMTNSEGGTDDEEFRVAAVKDRIDTTMQVWMGLTMGCAKCHSHKYDPITQQEYYRFYAIFNQTADNDQPDERPTIAAPTAELERQMRRTEERIAALKKQLDVSTPQLDADQAKWEASLRGKVDWEILDVQSAVSEGGAVIKKQPDGSLRAEGSSVVTDAYVVTAKTQRKGLIAVRVEAIPDPQLPGGGSGRAADGSYVVSRVALSATPAEQASKPLLGRFVRVELPGEDRILSLAEVQVWNGTENVARAGQASQSSTDYEGPAQLAIDGNTDGRYLLAKSTTHTRIETNPWWEVKLAKPGPIDRVVIWNRTDIAVGSRLANFRVQVLDDAHKVVWSQDVVRPPEPQRELTPSNRTSIALKEALADFQQDGLALSDVIKVNDKSTGGWGIKPRQKEPHSLVVVSNEPLAVTVPAVLTLRMESRVRSGGQPLGRFRLSATDDIHLVERFKVPAALLAIVDTPVEKRTVEQKATLARHYRTLAPSLKSVRDEIARLEKEKPAVPMLPVMVELPLGQRRVTHLQVKGNFLNHGDKVEPGTPTAFPALPAGVVPDRLAVARWLVSADNPLTARVAVNRFWAQLFGTGLVETEEDFGTQGELPSHAELLDWLAIQYSQALHWDTKAFLKLLVTSATYRQSSRVTPELLAKDPRNRLLSRGPRFRLEAEMVRDQALALSGLLSTKIGGPSVYPPQPEGLWQAAFNGQRTWATSPGDDRYRRGLYTFWRRTVPYPSMATFDAPSREICSLRRIRTNTPLQAFVTLNDPVYVEAAQALARRIMREGGVTIEDRVRFGLQLCLARPPQEEQVKHLVALVQEQRAHFAKDLKSAQALAIEPLGPLPVGFEAPDAAAWTVVANVLLNLDGVLTKG